MQGQVTGSALVILVILNDFKNVFLKQDKSMEIKSIPPVITPVTKPASSIRRKPHKRPIISGNQIRRTVEHRPHKAFLEIVEEQ